MTSPNQQAFSIPRQILERWQCVLATLLVTTTSACSSLYQPLISSPCKTRAFTRDTQETSGSSAIANRSDARLGIFAFDVPENLAAAVPDRGNSGEYLASRLQQQVLGSGIVTIVEVVPHHDWPGKKEEFYRGNFDALKLGKDLGYNLILLANLTPQQTLDTAAAVVKVIDVSDHVTLDYFETSFSPQKTSTLLPRRLHPETMPPTSNYPLLDGLAACIADHLRAAEGGEEALPDY